MKGTSRKYQYKVGVTPTRETDPTIRGSLERLKLEVALKTSAFWKTRGLDEPLSEFKHLNFGKAA